MPGFEPGTSPNFEMQEGQLPPPVDPSPLRPFWINISAFKRKFKFFFQATWSAISFLILMETPRAAFCIVVTRLRQVLHRHWQSDE